MTNSDIKETFVGWFIVNLSDLLILVCPKRRSKVFSHLSCLVELLGDLVAEEVDGI